MVEEIIIREWEREVGINGNTCITKEQIYITRNTVVTPEVMKKYEGAPWVTKLRSINKGTQQVINELSLGFYKTKEDAIESLLEY